MCALFQSKVPPSAPLTVEPAPARFPAMMGAELAADFLGTRIAGDLYDSFRVSPERVLFGLLDVAGRREDNGAILDAAQNIFRTFGAELFSGPDINESDSMTELSLRINRTLLETSHGVHPCPAFFGCYHEKFGTLCYSNAGHTPGLLRDDSGITELGSTGLPLGLFSHVTSEAPTIGIEKGAALLLVSRGLVECEGGPKRSIEEFGMDRVKQLFQAAPIASAQALSAFVLNSVRDFGAAALQCEDRTALALLRT
ncbi:MAG TPA: PP2C family protein-serine/threonine phosphatase [Candidatus Sulfotelmatobacter sp.]|nr:PP2C family protein-serine/threonine phosphatase [Candidatus Sulfotelmatobacter sp.]